MMGRGGDPVVAADALYLMIIHHNTIQYTTIQYYVT